MGESRTRGHRLSIKVCTFRKMRRNFLSEAGESVDFFAADGWRGQVIAHFLKPRLAGS